MPDLSVLIPARREMFLGRTIESILAASEGDTEIIAVLDGDWADPPIPDHPKVTLIKVKESIGQRAATNLAARLSDATFLMKCDAHCSFDQGFDVKLMAHCEADWTVIPRMYNLHAFDWLCEGCGTRTYQGPTPTTCSTCGGKGTAGGPFRREMVWQRRESRKTDFARFDSDLHFQYFGNYNERKEAKGDIADVMSSIGACWFMRRARFWDLGGMDEAHGSWGQFGTELACKSWLSGGRQVVLKAAWFAHMFRTQGGDFGFPYPLPGSQQEHARAYSQDLWRGNKWPRQKLPLRWLIDKFWPVPGWTEAQRDALPKELPHDARGRTHAQAGATQTRAGGDHAGPGGADPESAPARDGGRVRAAESRSRRARHRAHSSLTAGILYYTCNTHDLSIELPVRRHLQACRNGHGLTTVSRQPIEFGDVNLVLEGERSAVMMHKQILAGLEKMTTDLVFLVESDVLYHKSHFEFIPPDTETFFYNEHTYKVDADSGAAVFYYTKQVSGCCAYRTLLLEHYQKRVARILAEGKFDLKIGYEPGCHQFPRGIDDRKAARWMSPFPNVDIRHGHNITKTRWRQEDFRDPRACQGWKIVDEIPGWGKTKGRFPDFLAEVAP